MKKQKENNWQYYGLFLDKDTRDKLISFIDNSKWNYLFEELSKVYLDHCTLLHQAQYNEDPFVGTSIKYCLLKFGCTHINLLLSHIGYSDKAMAFKVIFLPTEMYAYEICFNDTPLLLTKNGRLKYGVSSQLFQSKELKKTLRKQSEKNESIYYLY